MRADSDRGPGRSRATFVVALLGFVLVGGAWAAGMPAFGGPDEPAHAYRAIAVTSGQLRGPSIDRVEQLPDGAVFRHPATQVDVPADVVDLAEQAECFAFEPEVSAACREPVADDRDTVQAGTQFGRYPPLYYALVGWPGQWLPATPAVHAMRLLSVLLCALPIALAAGLLAGRPVRLLGLGLAATPTLVFLAGTINPSGLEVALAILLWVLADRLGDRGARAGPGIVFGVAASAVLLSAMRPVSPAFVVAIAVVAVVRHGRPGLLRELRARTDVRVAAGLALTGIVLSVAWLVWADPFGALIGTSMPGLSVARAAWQSLSRTPHRVIEMVGVFGWLDTYAHVPVYVVWLVVSAGMVTIAGVVGRWRDRAALGLVLFGVLLMPVVSEALQAPDLGFIWQGRYTLPLAVGALIVAAGVADDHLDARIHRRARHADRDAALVWLALALAQLVAFAAAMRRHLDGLPARLFGWVDGAEAAPVVPAPVLLTAVVLGLGVVSAGLLASARVADRVPASR